jgi:aspartyl-tRNA(Asn)/glutamyl-tRNA(Gln) amidotransferase subunit B
MFCGCSADHFGKQPNTQTCPVCLGLPGALPVPNKKAIEWTILTGLALNCQIPKFSKFDRKNYFYPDLPKGYQISQYDSPLAVNGWLKLKNGNKIRIRRTHLEEDTGKLIHQTINNKKYSLVDFNRSGVPLMEIVTEPDLHSSTEAKEFLERLQMIVRYLGVSDAEMEKGQMRCEPTVNLKIEDDNKEFYTPLVEIKNINSFRFVQKAIDFETNRLFEEFLQTRIEKKAGNKTTRGWDEKKGVTVLQRAKEEASDYRYFPEPDIPPIEWTDKDIENFKLKIEKLESPDKKIERFVEQYQIPISFANTLCQDLKLADFFQAAVECGKKYGISPQSIANVIVNRRIEYKNLSPEELMEKISSLSNFTVSGEEISRLVEKTMKEFPAAIEDYKKGKIQSLGFLVGQVQRKTKGKSDPKIVQKILLEKLGN